MPKQDAGTQVVIITGLSGAGRSQTAKSLEDIGYFVVDNLPTVMISELVATAGAAEGDRSRIAVVTDTRTGMNAVNLDLALIDLHRDGLRTTVLFLDADDVALVRRFEETRRPHPGTGTSLAKAIAEERKTLEPVRALADVIVDTSDLNVHQLRERLRDAFAGVDASPSMRVDVTSFGFKRGTPRVVDLMFDVRFLPNPHWEPELRKLTGLDAPVRDYVFSHPEAGEFLDKAADMLEFLIPHYETEGKSYLTIAVGCTGGRHRSVAVAEAIASRLVNSGIETSIHHRDITL
ncbi:MAG: RNase adapter RapZ [Acidimicrobiia bacterium]|nr:MAG: RNase adapter RapZ [Acidimicrobiia bacterium]